MAAVKAALEAAAAGPSELPTFEHFTTKRKLGDGTFGEVFAAVDTRTALMCAIKRPHKLRAKGGVEVQAYREMNLLRGLEHPCVVGLISAFLDPKPTQGSSRALNLVLEYVEGGDLAQRIKLQHEQGAAFPPDTLRSIARQLVEGVAFLHAHWVMHRDLKPANVLLSAGDRVKIADFGMARSFWSPLHSLGHDGTVVTLWYRAPELLLGTKAYTPAIDNWAVGCILAEMQRGTIIFPGTEVRGGELQADQLHRLFSTLGMPRDELWPQGLPHWPTVQRWRAADYPDADALPSALATGCSPALLSLLRGLLRLNPACRCTAKDALAHAYWPSESDPAAPAVDVADGCQGR